MPADTTGMAGVVIGITIFVVCVVVWGHGVKWASDQWGGTEKAFVGAVVLGLIFAPLFVVIGGATEVKRIIDNKDAKANAQLPEQ